MNFFCSTQGFNCWGPKLNNLLGAVCIDSTIEIKSLAQNALKKKKFIVVTIL